MNIPPEVARAQANHGIKGAVHGIKGGRPRLDLTDDERAKRRRKQQEAYRRKNGIPPKQVLTLEERQERNQKQRDEYFNEEYHSVWHKLPGEPLTAAEFKNRYPAFRKWVRECLGRGNRLYWAVAFVREHHRQERRRERAERIDDTDADPLPQAERAERKIQTQPTQRVWQDWVPPLSPLVEMPSVGRNQPCPCGSGRKFKKCCGP